MRFSIFSLGLVACLLAVQSASAAIYTTYSFQGLTPPTDPANILIGESQLFLNVVDIGPGAVRFEFRNLGPDNASITDIYFDDGTLLGIATIAESTGVNFTPNIISPVGPPNLGYAGTINFNPTAIFTMDADPSTSEDNGVGASEWLVVDFTLQAGHSYTTVNQAIALSLANPGVDIGGGLRIGIKVEHIGPAGSSSGGSEEFINGVALPPNSQPAPLPEPATLAIWGMGLGIAGLVRLRRRRK